MSNKYISPLSNRYGSDGMRYIWSEQNKVMSWRHLWCILAESEMELGVNITQEQIADLKNNVGNINQGTIDTYEARTKHDVVANILAYGDVAPVGKPVIHLGVTSQYVVDNAVSLMIRDSLIKLLVNASEVISVLGDFAEKYKDLPTVGLTHLQAAQPTTVGKRSTLWIQDFVTAVEDLGFRLDNLKLRGVKGTTGTQASFMNLFSGDEERVQKLDGLIATKLGFDDSNLLKITGQTAPRINDATLISSVCLIASAAGKFASDIRLLSSRRELSEGFEDDGQVGSSAMAYKKNPIACEKICSLSRYLISLLQNPYHTAANQWMERSLDDSANRRILLPEVFIVADEILESVLHVVSEMGVNEEIVTKNYEQELPFFITENIIIEAMKKNGADRQEAHEEIRKLSLDAQNRINQGKTNNLVYRISRKKMFKNINVKDMLKLDYTGMAGKQTASYVGEVVSKIRAVYLGIDSQ